MSDRLWITWEDQRRNRELSKALHAKFIELKKIDLIKNRFSKYSQGIFKTIQVILQERPKIIFGQNPSLVLSLLLVSIKPLFGFKVIIDAHNAGIFPAEGRSALLMGMSRFIQRHADVVIVSNEGLHQHVAANKSRSFILQDKIPDISPGGALRKLKGRINLLFICSYAADEPYEAVIEAAAGLPEDIRVYITGNFKKASRLPANLPLNVELTGFLPLEEFEIMLRSVDATIDLTTRKDCLVCGAYESVAVEKPMILSDTIALRHSFHTGAVYTIHSTAALQKAMLDLVDRKEELTAQVKHLKKEKTVAWEKQRQLFERYLSELNS
jgi:hypothetical protein